MNVYQIKGTERIPAFQIGGYSEEQAITIPFQFDWNHGRSNRSTIGCGAGLCMGNNYTMVGMFVQYDAINNLTLKYFELQWETILMLIYKFSMDLSGDSQIIISQVLVLKSCFWSAQNNRDINSRCSKILVIWNIIF